MENELHLTAFFIFIEDFDVILNSGFLLNYFVILILDIIFFPIKKIKIDENILI